MQMKNESPEKWSFILDRTFSIQKKTVSGRAKENDHTGKQTHTHTHKKIQVGLIGITRKQDRQIKIF